MDLKNISRSRIPSLERRGAVAFGVLGRLVSITCHNASVDIETLHGVPERVSSGMMGVAFGLENVVFLGSLGDGVINMIDVMVYNGKKIQGWEMRRDLLVDLYGGLPGDVREKYLLSEQIKSGLVNSFDRFSSFGGGLLLRLSGKPTGYVCLGGVHDQIQ